MTMLAKAVRAVEHELTMAGFDYVAGRSVCEGLARSVLMAVRNLDAEGVGSTGLNALVKGRESLYSCSEDPELDDARQCFTAMIDAILEGK